MDRRFYYGNGLPFEDKLARVIDSNIDRVKQKKASMIIIDGGLGNGKTTLLTEILDYINKKHDLPVIDFKGPQLALGGADFLKKLRQCHENKLPCIGYDEAGDFSRRGSLTQFNAMLNRTFETFRAFHCIVVLALPIFNSLDQELFDKQIPRLLLHVQNRKTTGLLTGYSLYRMNLMRERMKKTLLKQFAYQIIRPNFHSRFKNLTPAREKELDKVSTFNKLSVLRESEVKIEGLLNYSEVATKLFKSVIWVRLAVNNLNLKPKRIIKCQKYFDKSIVDILADHADTIQREKKVGRKKKQ